LTCWYVDAELIFYNCFLLLKIPGFGPKMSIRSTGAQEK